MYRLLLSRRWLVAHVVLVAAVGLCVTAGMWQLARLEARRTLNETVAARTGLEPRPLAAVLAGHDLEELSFRPVTVGGAYDAEREVVLYGRAREGRPGHHVLTPLRPDGGRAIVVDRGWVPQEWDSPPLEDARPPEGEVEVTGFLLEPEAAGEPAAEAPAVRQILRVDLVRLGQQLPYEIEPVYLVLQEQRPPQAGMPLAPAVRTLDEGPHLGYAIQWFSFALIALVTYAALLRKEVRGRRTRTEPGAPVGSRD